MKYIRGPWTAERRERVSAVARARCGAPEGFCTIYGVHVPFEHRDPVRYWAGWVAHHQGKEAARQFILDMKANDWALVEKIRELWLQRKEIAHNRELIRRVEWEAFRGN